MPYDAESLYTLLPQYLRLRDAREGEPLRALVKVLADQAELVEENIAQLYDDLFIETADDWVIPYIGDLLGIVPLAPAGATLSPRAEVANTIALRRRKGTPGALGQLARELTGWETRVVEFFDCLASNQHLAAPRIDRPASALIRGPRAQSAPFDLLPRNVDVRSSHGLPRPNLTQIGLFVWRLATHSITRAPACPFPNDSARFRFHSAGVDAPLVNLPLPDDFRQQPAEPRSLPVEISRLALDADLHRAAPLFYGRALKLELVDTGPQGRPKPGAIPVLVPTKDVQSANLGDSATGKWLGKTASGKFDIDPQLGRLRAGSLPPGKALLVTSHHAFSADLGGGEYARAEQPGEALLQIKAADDAAALLAGFAGSGVIELTENARHTGTLKVTAAASLTLQAGPRLQPVLAPLGDLIIDAAPGSEIVLRGLLISGCLRVTGAAARVRLEHCTLVPVQGAPSLLIESPGATLELAFSITGAIRIPATARAQISDSILDAGSPSQNVFAALDGKSAGAALQVETSTLIGRVHANSLPLALNAIFHGLGEPMEASVRITRRQGSIARHCWLPLDAEVAARASCLPSALHPESLLFTSSRYGQPGYLQLGERCPAVIRAGADTHAEPGAFHHLFNAQRETNLETRLGEYLPFGLQAGLIHAS